MTLVLTVLLFTVLLWMANHPVRFKAALWAREYGCGYQSYGKGLTAGVKFPGGQLTLSLSRTLRRIRLSHDWWWAWEWLEVGWQGNTHVMGEYIKGRLYIYSYVPELLRSLWPSLLRKLRMNERWLEYRAYNWIRSQLSALEWKYYGSARPACGTARKTYHRGAVELLRIYEEWYKSSRAMGGIRLHRFDDRCRITVFGFRILEVRQF